MLNDNDTLVKSFGRTLARGESIRCAGQFAFLLTGHAFVSERSPQSGVQTARRAGPGEIAGEEALADPNHALTLRALDSVQALLLRDADITGLMQARPELGSQLLRALYARLRAISAAAHPAAEGALAQVANTVKDVPPVAANATSPVAIDYRAEPTINQDLFYADSVTCPVCETTFAHARVRTRAVSAHKRDSDFHYWYRTVNPAHYAVVACPRCGYAAYHDDFTKLTAEESGALRGRQPVDLAPDLRGERDTHAAGRSIELALDSYRAKGNEPRRMAGLIHRLAWLARERGDDDLEQEHLRRALEEYQRAYETDRHLTDADSVSLSYLIGEISLRLGDYAEAVRWFTIVTRMEESKKHREILRLTRERWADAREAMVRERGISA